MSVGERYEGTVKSWKEPWGWVSSPSVGSDVFCHIQDLQSGHLGKDASVTFELGTDQKSGKPRALNIEVLGVADRPESETGQRLTGSIASWKEAWGFISSPELDAQIFGHREDLVNADPHCGLEVGAEVRFDVSTDDKSGKPRAKRIELLNVPDKLTGEILSWKDQWGWIKCHQVEGGDIFAHSDDLLTIVQVGVKVTFEMGSDKKSGKRRARNIAAVGSKGKGGKDKGKGKEMMMMPMQMPMHHGYGGGPPDAYGGFFGGPPDGYGKGGYGKAGKPGKGFGAPMGPYGKGMMSGHGPPPMAGYGGKGGLPGPQAFIGQQLEGHVAMWKDLWGWISCPHFGGDIFAHQEDLNGGNPSPGSAVVFVPGTDNKGRMRALMIRPLGGGGGHSGGKSKRKGAGKEKERPGEADFEQLDGSVIEGECSSWKSPWGWIQSPNYTGDLFAHVEDVLSGEELVKGQKVSFTVARDHKSGRWRAREINAGAI